MSTPTPLHGFVLAGGLSLRMGRDKALLEWRGHTLLEHMSQLLETVCDSVQTIGRPDRPDQTPGLGPIGGIQTVLRSTAAQDNLVVAVDLPFLTEDFLKYFKQRFASSPHELIACRIGAAFPLLLGIRRSSLPTLESFIREGGRSIHAFIGRVTAEVLGIDEIRDAGFDEGIFLNLNTPEQYHQATARDRRTRNPLSSENF
jgi:molybdopterin-guanine dinucleotide biosynthesis protein A